jgi:pentatricopeptide repeat protein
MQDVDVGRSNFSCRSGSEENIIGTLLPCLNCTAQALGEQGQCTEAVACLDAMRRDGLTPNTITYTALLASCRSQLSLVPPLMQRLRREKGLANTIVLTSAIGTLVHGDADCQRKLVSSVCACKILPLCACSHDDARKLGDAAPMPLQYHTCTSVFPSFISVPFSNVECFSMFFSHHPQGARCSCTRRWRRPVRRPT